MAKKINFYTKKQIAQLKKLKGSEEIKKFAKENNRTYTGVMSSRSYYRKLNRENRVSAGKRAAQTRKDNVNSNSGVIKSATRGEFVIPVKGVEVRNTQNGINLIFKY